MYIINIDHMTHFQDATLNGHTVGCFSSDLKLTTLNSVKRQKKCQIQRKVLLSAYTCSFHLNGHTLGSYPKTQKVRTMLYNTARGGGGRVGGGGVPCWSEMLNYTPKGDQSGRGPSFL